MTNPRFNNTNAAVIESNFVLDPRRWLKRLRPDPLIVENGADGNGDICGEINAAIFEIKEIGDAYILDYGCNRVFALLIGEHSVMISGD